MICVEINPSFSQTVNFIDKSEFRDNFTMSLLG